MKNSLSSSLKKFALDHASHSVYISTKFIEHIEPRIKGSPLSNSQKARIEVFYAYILFFRDRLIQKYFKAEEKSFGSPKECLFSKKFKDSLKTDIAYEIFNDRYNLKATMNTPEKLFREYLDVINLINNPKNHQKNDIPDKDVWITKNDKEEFCFDGKPLKKLSGNALYAKVFKLVFDHLGKIGGAMSYGDIMKLSRGKIPQLHTTKNRTRKQITTTIRNALTGKKNGFFRATNIPKEQYGILETWEHEGIILFNNKR